MKLMLAQYFNIVRSCTEAGAAGRTETQAGPVRAAADRRASYHAWRVEKGFTLLEMMVSTVIFLSIAGTALSVMSFHQKTSQTVQLKADMYQSLRGATELMTQEVGQAGLVSLPTPLPTLGAAVAPSAVGQVVAVSSAASMFVGEQLDIDVGAAEELVTLTAVVDSANTITAIFSNPHPNGAVIKVLGNMWNGILPSSDATHLKLLGDINSDGSFVYVEYTCAPNAVGTPGGTLSRAVTTVTPLTTTAGLSAAANLLTNVVANPGGTACFQYNTVASPYTPVPANVTIDGTVYAFAPVWNVAITLSVQTAERDPQTGRYLTMTKSLLNVAPRNVLMSLEAATSAPQVVSVLQPTPANALLF